jgi:hypothetical protein
VTQLSLRLSDQSVLFMLHVCVPYFSWFYWSNSRPVRRTLVLQIYEASYRNIFFIRYFSCLWAKYSPQRRDLTPIWPYQKSGGRGSLHYVRVVVISVPQGVKMVKIPTSARIGVVGSIRRPFFEPRLGQEYFPSDHPWSPHNLQSGKYWSLFSSPK